MASRYVEVQLDGRSWRMPATRSVWLQLARTGLDPLLITWQLGRGEFDWTLEKLTTIVHTGAEAAGCPLKRDEVQEQIFQASAVSFIVVAASYVHALVEGGPEKPVQAQGSASPK
jgi:hypothetical protein